MGLLESLGSGLGYVGDSLDKPGRAVRGLLAGKAREGLAALPFSDSLGITDEHDKTTGRDLLDHYGITDKHDQSFGASALGFGAELATDPLSLLGGYGAYKAAPTVGKGLVAGAKAVSGLDLLDSLRAGGRAIGKRFRPVGDGASLAATLGHTLPPALPDVSDDLIRGTRVPGAMGFGGDLDDEAPSLGMRFLRNGKDAELGSTHFGEPSNMDSGAAARMFPHAVQLGDPTRRINGIELSPKYRGKGLGQAMYLDMMGQHPGHWFYNSQASSSAAAAADALESKGLIEHYRLPGEGERPHVGRITDAGLEALSHPDLLKSLRQGLGFPDPLPLPPRPGETAMMGMPPLREMPTGGRKPGLLEQLGLTWDAPSAPGMMNMVDSPAGSGAGVSHALDPVAEAKSLWTQENQELLSRVMGDPHFPYNTDHYKKFLGSELPHQQYYGAKNAIGYASKYLRQTDPHFIHDLWTPENRDLIDRAFPLPHDADPTEVSSLQALASQADAGDLPRDELVRYLSESRNQLGMPAMEDEAGDTLAKLLAESHPTDNFVDPHSGQWVDKDKLQNYVRSWYDFSQSPEHSASAEDIHEALQAYTAFGHHKINSVFRNAAETGVAPNFADTPGRNANSLNRMFDVSRAPQDLRGLYRGVEGNGVKAIEHQLGVPIDSPEAIGRSFVEPGFLSTSSDDSISRNFADAVNYSSGADPSFAGRRALFEFNPVPAGRPAAPASLGESEILFPPGRRITIRDNSQYPHIKADLLSALLAALGGASVAGAMNTQPSMN